MKYVYSEGVIARSRRNPKVQSGELPLITPTITREEWIPWRYWLYRIARAYFHTVMRWVPPLRGWIDRRWCTGLEIALYRPNDHTTIPIDPTFIRPDRRARYEEWLRDREARSPDPGPNG